jgi:hypothetical protein
LVNLSGFVASFVEDASPRRLFYLLRRLHFLTEGPIIRAKLPEITELTDEYFFLSIQTYGLELAKQKGHLHRHFGQVLDTLGM